jgi:hypothetical protein
MVSQLERAETGNKEAVDRTTKYTAMRKELDDLTKLHEDGKKAVCSVHFFPALCLHYLVASNRSTTTQGGA